jgi:hypothetical protein
MAILVTPGPGLEVLFVGAKVKVEQMCIGIGFGDLDLRFDYRGKIFST